MSAKATAIFDGDDSKLQAALKRIDRNLHATQERFANLTQTVRNIGEAFAVFEVAQKTMEGMRGALDAGAHLKDLSANTGIAVRDLAILEQQFKAAGKSAEDVGPVMAHMMRSIGSGSASSVIGQLGLSFDDLSKKNPAQQFAQIGSAINKLGSPVERANAAMEIFGKSGSTLLAMFRDEGFGSAAEQVGHQAEILQEDAGMFADASRKLALAPSKWEGFWVGFTDRTLPEFSAVLDKFASTDFSTLGQAFGDATAAMIESMTDGKWIAIMGTALEISLLEAANEFIRVLLAGETLLFDKLAGLSDAIAKHLGGNSILFHRLASEAGRGVDQTAFNTEGLHEKLNDLLGGPMSSAAATRAQQMAKYPTDSEGNQSEWYLPQTANVSQLQSIGGNFGGGSAGADPVHAKLDRQTNLLQQIEQNTRLQSSHPTPSHGAHYHKGL